MSEKTIQYESMTFRFVMNEGAWQLKLPKSQTRVKDVRQLALITESPDFFVPATVDDENDAFSFSFTVDPQAKKWEDVRKLGRNDKLRLLCNVARLETCLSSRLTFFLHPDNLVFDDNLMPRVVYRGIRRSVPPYEMDAKKFFTQYKCLIVALFSKKYSFDELYAGSLQHAKDTEFERRVGEIDDFNALIQFLNKSYKKEQASTENNMQLVSKRRFRLFKRLAITMIVLAILLAVPLAYFWFAKAPQQERLLAAHRDFLARDYDRVISDLQGLNPDNLSNTMKYVLAYSYVQVERLSDDQKAAIMNNISLKSDPNYLLYWIYNGRGDFEKSTDLAKYIDDPQLIMYGLIQQIDQAKNDPNMSGSEREELVLSLQDELNTYREEFTLEEEHNPSIPASTDEQNQTDPTDTDSDHNGQEDEASETTDTTQDDTTEPAAEDEDVDQEQTENE